MAQYGDQYGNCQNQEFGTQPTHDHKGGMMVGEHPQQQQKLEQHCEQEKLHRTGSSSSSEDDGEGGRRKKKGLTEKIMEKIPGVGNKEPKLVSHETAGANTTAATGGEAVHGEEKKGLMDKIKEKLPGTN